MKPVADRRPKTESKQPAPAVAGGSIFLVNGEQNAGKVAGARIKKPEGIDLADIYSAALRSL